MLVSFPANIQQHFSLSLEVSFERLKPCPGDKTKKPRNQQNADISGFNHASVKIFPTPSTPPGNNYGACIIRSLQPIYCTFVI